MDRYVVLIDAGGKQDFIFASNKQAANIGASDLIRILGEEWVPDAIAKVAAELAPDAVTKRWEIVVASGKAVLEVPSGDIARAIIRKVTKRALDEAPGLLVCGVIVPVTDSLGVAVNAAHGEYRRHRPTLPPVELRTPTLPYVQPCQYSGLPATTTERETERPQPDGSKLRKVPRARAIHEAWKRSRKARDHMASEVLHAEEEVLDREKLDQGVDDKGWIAIVHADGNGIGALFDGLARLFADDDEKYREVYGKLSRGLDETAQKALRAAIDAKDEKKEPVSDWILPIVVAGDDVTVIMDGRVAFDVTCAFLKAFEELSGQGKVHEALSEIRREHEKQRTNGDVPDRLTAAAGIAFVKRHHPFADAYELAEELCGSAKLLKPVGRARGMLDFHVLHDSLARHLSDLRSEEAGQIVTDGDGGQLRLWGGPYLLGHSGLGRPDGSESDRDLIWLREAAKELRPGEGFLSQDTRPAGDQKDSEQTSAPEPALSIGALLRLRDALAAGGDRIDRDRARIQDWADHPDQAEDYLDKHLRVNAPEIQKTAGPVNTPFTRLVDALHLLDMRHGTTAEDETRREEQPA